ncbi:sphere organelles protein-related [Abeliophyllum distichum]|uniref:Sphere organelles protein-related n=1 Tax=Abeliophyllum distichum TaxID=126358 RepID=A0ABD1W0Z4_9LAMI
MHPAKTSQYSLSQNTHPHSELIELLHGMESTRRVRLVFKDGDVLSETQKSEGLNRSWVLLKINQQKTISDVVYHLLHTFQLQQSCPDGLLLSIDGFVLPPFESTCIIKDKDIIRVKKRANTLSIEGNNVAIEGNNVANLVDKLKALEKQPVNSGVLLLANEEFEKEKGGYESDEPEEDDEESLKGLEGTLGGNDVSKKRKRKAVEECHDSKKKKQRSEAPKNVAHVHSEKIRSHQDGVRMEKKSLSKKENIFDFEDAENVENIEDVMRSEKPKQNGQEIEGAALAPQEPKKISRSSRRKYAKRKLIQEMVKILKTNEACGSEGLQNRKKDRGKAKRNETDCQSKGQRSWRKDRAKMERNEMDGQPKGLLHWKQLSGSNMPTTSKKCQQQTQTIELHKHPHQNGEVHEEPIQNDEVHDKPNQNGDTEWSNELGEEAEVVPVVVRPGHIRFEPLEKEHAVEQNEVPADTLQWNGITSKKKGQKWGRDKHTFTPRNDRKDSYKDFSEILSNGKEKLSDEGIDFDKLPPLADVPKEGDLIAYRILELSSSWTPELSPYRVGKVSWVNTESSRTMLMPVPEYPVFSKKLDEDESPTEPDNSLYKEDGSLEVDLCSLVDVRIVKGGNTGLRNVSPSQDNEGPVDNNNAARPEFPSSNDEQICAPTPEHAELNDGKQTQSPTIDNGVNAWDQISATLNAKKAQLLLENSCGKESSGKKSWSYKALRGSALGPTMAILRSKKEI